MDGGRWKLTAKLKQNTYTHIRHPNDPLISAIHIHHAQKTTNTWYFNTDEGTWMPEVGK
jgi:hypothetical protein